MLYPPLSKGPPVREPPLDKGDTMRAAAGVPLSLLAGRVPHPHLPLHRVGVHAVLPGHSGDHQLHPEPDDAGVPVHDLPEGGGDGCVCSPIKQGNTSIVVQPEVVMIIFLKKKQGGNLVHFGIKINHTHAKP